MKIPNTYQMNLLFQGILGLSFVFLIPIEAPSLNLYFLQSNHSWLGMLTVAVAGFVGLVGSHVFGTRTPPSLGQFFPLMMLSLFLVVLNSLPLQKSAAVFFTGAALLWLRTLLLFLAQMRASQNGVPRGAIVLLITLVLGVVFCAMKVILLFQGISAFWISERAIQVMSIGLILGWKWIKGRTAIPLVPGALAVWFPGGLGVGVTLLAIGMFWEQRKLRS